MSAVLLLTVGLVFAGYNGVRYFADPVNRAFTAAQWRDVRLAFRRSGELPEDRALRELVKVDRRIAGGNEREVKRP